MTDFEMIRDIYKHKNINVYVTDGNYTDIPIIEDMETQITFWFNSDGSLDFISNDKEY